MVSKAGFWMLDTGYSILDIGNSISGTLSRIQHRFQQLAMVVLYFVKYD